MKRLLANKTIIAITCIIIIKITIIVNGPLFLNYNICTVVNDSDTFFKHFDIL